MGGSSYNGNQYQLKRGYDGNDSLLAAKNRPHIGEYVPSAAEEAQRAARNTVLEIFGTESGLVPVDHPKGPMRWHEDGGLTSIPVDPLQK